MAHPIRSWLHAPALALALVLAALAAPAVRSAVIREDGAGNGREPGEKPDRQVRDIFSEDLRAGTPEETVRRVVDAVEGKPQRRPWPEERTSVLVVVEPGSPRRAVLDFTAAKGARCRYEYKLLPNVVNLRGIERKDVETLKHMPGVLRVEEDREVRIYLNDSTPLVRGLQSQIQARGLEADGSGMRVCIVDTGIDPDHTMFAGRIDSAAGYDFANDDPDPTDDHGHGSHVAGIALGRIGFDVDFGGGSGSEPLQGVAPQATLIGVKVLGAGGSGDFSDVIAGIDHCADPALPGGRADVINMSLGGGLFRAVCDDDLAAMASNAAVDAGVVVVVAAGNAGSANGVGTPACASGTIAVAATWDDDFPNPDFPDRDSFSFVPICQEINPRVDDRICFSNRSPQIDVAGPGCLTYSADGLDPATQEIRGLCGTSMSAPHVAGLAALVLDADPSLSPSDVRQLLRESAVDLGPPGFDVGYGHGRIDAVSALGLASSCGVDDDCDDGLFCNGFEVCDAGSCEPGGAACPRQFCDEATDSCAPCAADADCSDGVVCNGVETCTAGFCQAGPLACVELCDELRNTCVQCFTDADCTDGDFCNGVETCDAGGQCRLRITDCNDNAVDDLCDIDAGTSPDVAPQNGVPDECDALVRFTVAEIPTLGGDVAEAHRINSAGHVVGYSETGEVGPGGRLLRHAFVWDGSSITDLGTLGGEDSFAYDINDSGVIAGTADLEEAIPQPPLLAAFKNYPTQWIGGVPVQLESLPGFGWFNGTAWSINNLDHIGGNLINGYEMIRGAVWNAVDRPVEVPPQPHADMTDAWDVSDDGVAVGWMNEMYLGFNRRAFRWVVDSGSPADLGTLGGIWGWALAINERNDIVGQSSTAEGFLHPFLWQGGPAFLRDLGTLGGTFALARGINDGRQVVGTSTSVTSLTLSDRLAFLWEDDTMQDLNDLVPGNLGWTLRDAWDVNNVGQISGHGLNASGAVRGFRLDPCGGPGSPCFESDCTVDSDCDDGVFCNGVETCPAGICSRAFPPACDDTVACTVDFCDQESDSCRNLGPPPAPPVFRLTLNPASPGSSFAELAWEPVPEADSYTVYRATRGDLFDLGCLIEGLTATSGDDDGLLPGPGQALYYLVGAANCTGVSDLGLGAIPRPLPPACP